MYFDHRYNDDSIFGVFDQFRPFLKICSFTSFAYCSFAFFDHNLSVSFRSSMKLIPDVCFNLRHSFQYFFLKNYTNLAYSLIFWLFKAIFRLLRHIPKYRKFTQISFLTRATHFCKKNHINI